MTIDQALKTFIQKSFSFANLSSEDLDLLIQQSHLVSLQQGQTLIRNRVFETHIFLLVSGTVRLLAPNPFVEELFTVGTANSGDFIGLVSLLRQSPCESAIGKTPSKLVAFPSSLLAELLKSHNPYIKAETPIISPCEIAAVVSEILKRQSPSPLDPKNIILRAIASASNLSQIDINPTSLLSTVVPNYEKFVGLQLCECDFEVLKSKSVFPIRALNVSLIEESSSDNEKTIASDVSQLPPAKQPSSRWQYSNSLSLQDLGIREAETNFDLQGFKLIKGRGSVQANLATLRMTALAYGTPCPVDLIEKALEDFIARSGSIPIQIMGQLVETMGLQTQLGYIKISLLSKLEFPVIINYDNTYCLLSNVKNNTATLAHPALGWKTVDVKSLLPQDDKSEIQVVLIKRLADTPKRVFGWNWFSPVLKRFKWPLAQVLLASLFIQLFQLANPLLIQQIIDKVVNQSNLSALQVLGAALVASAFFQGLLTAVRTWLMIDTTDRMDLVLGSQVIDKLLRLPLRFFENRPVGELSQRLSELGTIRGFLTGTAITSSLDLLFATIYIFIMFIYSPLLTVVALSTIPLYILMIIFIAPIYRRLIRKQAQFSAKTQSHLIETLSGIQTVKAQHFELNSRWKWQERYSGQIQEGFKSVVLGSTAGEFGNFLNQLSSLLIIWVGVYLVVTGDLSLGQLIAFRIIAGYVTGPILRLSSLWQGFQQVGISMERLSDIVDQVPEAGQQDPSQIALPPIDGNITFENVKFRFSKKNGPYQIKNFNFEISAGSFVGIVGLSGSGKSTLMKLLPRLYEPNDGRILIDNYDISKVSLDSLRQQVGIVPQDCLLFEGTVRDNIALNHPEASTDDIINVAKAAEAHDFIMELSDGYATVLGERGSGLSGGQKQRIAIARTLLQNPNLLILDEATSALDYDTESNVCRNLQKILNGKTVFFITHRLSTIRNADQILLMSDGLLAEHGTHDELMNLSGRYATLYSHQGDA